jgi:hypothetical protein
MSPGAADTVTNFSCNACRARRNRTATGNNEPSVQVSENVPTVSAGRKHARRMRTMGRPVTVLGFTLMLLTATAAIGDTLTIKVFNDSADAIVATVYDLNAEPPGAAIMNQRIDGFSWIPVLVTAGASGNAHVRWIARTADPSFRQCGHHERRGLADEATVHVSANSRCDNHAH